MRWQYQSCIKNRWILSLQKRTWEIIYFGTYHIFVSLYTYLSSFYAHSMDIIEIIQKKNINIVLIRTSFMNEWMDEWKKEFIINLAFLNKLYTFRNVRGNMTTTFTLMSLYQRFTTILSPLYFVIYVSNAFVRYQFTSLLIFLFHSLTNIFILSTMRSVTPGWLRPSIFTEFIAYIEFIIHRLSYIIPIAKSAWLDLLLLFSCNIGSYLHFFLLSVIRIKKRLNYKKVLWFVKLYFVDIESRTTWNSITKHPTPDKKTNIE